MDMLRWTRLRRTTLGAAVLAALLTGCDGGDDAPDAVALAQPDTTAVAWNAAATLDVTANDTAQNGAISLVVETPPQHGTAEVQGTTIRYVPAAGYFGADSLRYTLRVGDRSSSADVTLAVTAEFALEGTVRDAPLAGASVVATVGGSALPAVTAGADGSYRVVVRTADPAAFVRLQASGAGPQANVVLTTLLGDARDAAVTAAASSTDVTHVSTAQAVLTEQALGRAAASSADISAAQGQVSATQLIEMATAVKLVADNGVALPAGSADTLALLRSPSALAGFLQTQKVQNAPQVTAARTAVQGDAALAAKPAVPAAGGSTTLLLVQGEGGGAPSALRLTLNGDGTGRAETEAGPRDTHWSLAGNDIVVRYATPFVYEGLEDEAGFGAAGQVRVEFRTVGVTVRQVSSAPGTRPATVSIATEAAYLEGARAGAVEASPGSWDGQKIVASRQPFTAADMSPGKRWAGVLAHDHVHDPLSFVRNQDVLRIVDATAAVFERSQRSVPWRLVDGSLQLTLDGGVTVTYTRLFTGPQGEQRWLGERRSAAGVDWLHDSAVVQVQDSAVYTRAGLIAKWSSNLNDAYSVDPFFVELLDDGRTKRYSVVNGVAPNFPPRGAWTVSADGRTMVLDTIGDGCAQGVPGCDYWSRREWQLLAVNGDRLVVMEKVDITGYLQWRLTIYTRTP